MIGNDGARPDHSGFTIPYHNFRIGGTIHWCFWFGLPTLTRLQIWVKPCRGSPLPIITTAATRLTSNQIHHSELDSRAGGATVITVDNVENRWNHPEWWHGGGRCRKDFSFLKRSVGMHLKPYGGKTGRAMIKYPHTKKNAQPYKRAVYPGLEPCRLTVK